MNARTLVSALAAIAALVAVCPGRSAADLGASRRTAVVTAA